MVIAVRERGPFSLAATVDKVVITQGDKLEIPLKLERYVKDFATPVQVVPINLPQGVVVQPVTLSPGKDEATIALPFTTGVPVVLVYHTVEAKPDGTPRFYSDVYQVDPALEAALRKGYPYGKPQNAER